MTFATKALGLVLGAGLLACAALPQTAGAADYDPPPVVYSDWSGLYGGAHFGYAFGTSDYDVDQIAGPGGPFVNDNIDIDGVLGGVLVGYNVQSGNLVFGIEVDGFIGDVDGSETVGPTRLHYTMTAGGSARARLGWAMDRTLFFVTGGGALANFEVNTGPITVGTDEETHYGFVVGGGIEHKFDDSIALRAEYLYTHYFRENYHLGPPVQFFDRADIDTHVIRAAIVFHLGPIFGPN